jgi:hypothetical protein
LNRTLAHELVHAGQKEATVEVENALEAIKVRAQTKAMARFSEQEIAESQSHLTPLCSCCFHAQRVGRSFMKISLQSIIQWVAL